MSKKGQKTAQDIEAFVQKFRDVMAQIERDRLAFGFDNGELFNMMTGTIAERQAILRSDGFDQEDVVEITENGLVAREFPPEKREEGRTWNWYREQCGLAPLELP